MRWKPALQVLYHRDVTRTAIEQRAYYIANPDKLAKNRLKTKERARARKLALVQIMGGKCVDCGYDKHPAALDFDHRDRATKQFNVGHMLSMRWKKILAEAEECELRCANCHRVRTYAK